jgi:hypothetical protein
MTRNNSFVPLAAVVSIQPARLVLLFLCSILALAALSGAAAAQIPHFLAPVNYSVPGASMAVLADVNKDGVLDIITANGYGFQGGGVSLLLGRTNGTFQPAKLIVAAGNPQWIVAGDFNNDGKIDLAVSNTPDPDSAPPAGGPPADSVSLLLGNGDGTFRAPIITPTLAALAAVAADFNGDGKLDLAVVTGEASPDQILLGNGDGTFTVLTTSVNGFTGWIFSGDFNHDGNQDLLTGGWQMLGNGDGTFTFGQALPVTAAMIGDLNGDGIPDIGELDGTPHAVISTLAFGLPDGTWSPSFISNFSAFSNMLVADFDGDGKNDLFGAGRPALGPLNPSVGGLFLGDNSGFFTLVEPGFGLNFDSSQGRSFPLFVADGDLDHNGSPDIVIADGTGVAVYLNTAGHPPLLAQITTSTAFVLGGTEAMTGTVSLGGPAPAGGATVALTSSNVNAVVPATVLVPAGARTATFAIKTQQVAASTPVTIAATYHGVRLTARFTIVRPFALASVTVAPASVIGMFGGDAAVGTVTLSSPASDGLVISLASANPGSASVPASVAVAPGARTATFPIAAFHVPANTSVAVSATLNGITRSALLGVLTETGTVVVTKAEYVVKKSLLTIEATSTDRVASLQVFNPATGVMIGAIPIVNVGKFGGQVNVTGTLTSVAVQSSVGGLSIVPVAQK